MLSRDVQTPIHIFSDRCRTWVIEMLQLQELHTDTWADTTGLKRYADITQSGPEKVPPEEVVWLKGIVQDSE